MNLMRLHSSLVFTIKPNVNSIPCIPSLNPPYSSRPSQAVLHSYPPSDTAIKVDDLHLADMSIRLLTDKEKEKASY